MARHYTISKAVLAQRKSAASKARGRGPQENRRIMKTARESRGDHVLQSRALELHGEFACWFINNESLDCRRANLRLIDDAAPVMIQ